MKEDFNIFDDGGFSPEVEKQVSRVKKSIMDRLFIYLALLISLGFIAYGFFKFGLDEKPLSEILVDITFALTIGLALSVAWRMQGLKTGGNSKQVREVEEEHAREVVETRPYYKYQTGWSDLKLKESLEHIRSAILDGVSVNYSDVFDADGKLLSEGKVYQELLAQEKHENKRMRKQAKRSLNAIDEAVKAKARRLTLDDVIRLDGYKASDPNAVGDTPTDFIKKTSLRQVLFTMITALILGRITYDIVSANWTEVLFQVFQVVVFNAAGLFKFAQAYDFMINTHKENVAVKINHLTSLQAYGKRMKKEELENERME